jgi:hypothetical protein
VPMLPKRYSWHEGGQRAKYLETAFEI